MTNCLHKKNVKPVSSSICLILIHFDLNFILLFFLITPLYVRRYIKKWTCFVLGEFLKFGFSQFHRDWLNHRGAGAWKGCSSGMFSKSYLEILVWKKERTESNIFQRLLSITRKMCTTVKSKKLRKDALHNKFISTFPALEKSDHSEVDRKLIRAHWGVEGILAVIHPNILQTL